MRTRLFFAACLALTACDGGAPASVTCGAGTVLVDGTCVVDTMTMGDDGGPPPPPPMTDGGTPPPPPPPPGTDGGVGWGSTPPGAPPPPAGCDEASGECDAWESALLALVAAYPGRGCGTPLPLSPGVQTVAERHAAYQASVDRLTGESPDGNLFTQVRNEGVSYMYAGAAFSVTRDGASDVMDRWALNAQTAGVLAQCWTGAGVAIDTSASGASYVTVLLVR